MKETILCPKCGCRPRYVMMTARVKCVLNDDESVGNVVHVGKRVKDDVEYVCGGNHKFTIKEGNKP